MANGLFVVRAEVPDEKDRRRFDDWYASDHLPWAIKVFGAQRGWRCWSRSDPAVHYAFYEFDDVVQAQALIGSEKIKPLIADFDRVWGDRVARRRETLEIVQEMTPQEHRDAEIAPGRVISGPREISRGTLMDRAACAATGLGELGVGTGEAIGIVRRGASTSYPAEIEMALLVMPAVRDCAVFGIPDEEFGETLCAHIEPVSEALFGPAEVAVFLRERLADFKVPRVIKFETALPREDSGKIIKRKLREPYWAQTGRSI